MKHESTIAKLVTPVVPEVPVSGGPFFDSKALHNPQRQHMGCNKLCWSSKMASCHRTFDGTPVDPVVPETPVPPVMPAHRIELHKTRGMHTERSSQDVRVLWQNILSVVGKRS